MEGLTKMEKIIKTQVVLTTAKQNTGSAIAMGSFHGEKHNRTSPTYTPA